MGVDNWSTDPSGNDLQGNIDWSEGMAPAKVNDSAREMMAQIAKNILDRSGALTSTGSAASFALATNTGIMQLKNGLRFTFRANVDFAAGSTLNVDGKGAKRLRVVNADGERHIKAGEVVADGFYDVVYSPTSNGGAGAWIVQTADFTSINADIASIQTLLAQKLSLSGGTVTGDVRINGSADTHTLIVSKALDSTDEPATVLILSDGDTPADDMALEIRSNGTGQNVDDTTTMSSPDTVFAVFGGGFTAIGHASLGVNYSPPNDALLAVNGIIDAKTNIFIDDNIAVHAGNITNYKSGDSAKLNGQYASYYRNASNLNSGTVPEARLPNSVVLASTNTFADLQNKTAGTGDYSTDGDVVSGRGSGGVALTINDGQGNANVTFNHQDGVPEQDGNSARIVHNSDATANSKLTIELASGVTGGESVNTTEVAEFSEDGMKVLGSDVVTKADYGAGKGINADMLDGKHASYFATAAALSAIDVGVSNVRLGAQQTVSGVNTSGVTTLAAGMVVVGVAQGGGNITSLFSRPIQKQVDGTWYTVSQV